MDELEIIKEISEKIEQLNNLLGKAAKAGIEVRLNDIDISTIADSVREIKMFATFYKKLDVPHTIKPPRQ